MRRSREEETVSLSTPRWYAYDACSIHPAILCLRASFHKSKNEILGFRSGLGAEMRAVLATRTSLPYQIRSAKQNIFITLYRSVVINRKKNDIVYL